MRGQLGADADANATSAGGRESLAGLVADDEELMADHDFAEKAYVCVLSPERARPEAERQQGYRSPVAPRSLLQAARYPRRRRCASRSLPAAWCWRR
jgi:capsule polysaccharide export protein KpsE/RkpR